MKTNLVCRFKNYHIDLDSFSAIDFTNSNVLTLNEKFEMLDHIKNMYEQLNITNYEFITCYMSFFKSYYIAFYNYKRKEFNDDMKSRPIDFKLLIYHYLLEADRDRNLPDPIKLDRRDKKYFENFIRKHNN